MENKCRKNDKKKCPICGGCLAGPEPAPAPEAPAPAPGPEEGPAPEAPPCMDGAECPTKAKKCKQRDRAYCAICGQCAGGPAPPPAPPVLPVCEGDEKCPTDENDRCKKK